MAKLRVLELFAGIGACSKALTNLGIDHEIVDAVEIDKYAIKSFNAVHGTNFEPQDICGWNKDLECDLILHGSPCQDFSIAGKQAGGDEGSGTRSSLLYESLRVIEKTKPKYVIWENVKNLLGKKHRHNFDEYLKRMEELGYTNHYQILNAKDYGVPQNRERVFTVSIRNDIYKDFKFPARRPLTNHLKDVLETEVDEKYYLSDQQTQGFKFSNPDVAYCLDANYAKGTNVEQYLAKKRRQIVKVGDLDIKGNDQIKRVYGTEGVSPTLSTMAGGNRQPKIVASRGRGMNNKQHLEPRKDDLTNTITSVQKDNYVVEPKIVEDFYKNRPAREYDKVAPTLRSERAGLKVKDLRIRKLTPKECWRLMGFDDGDFEKAKNAGVSNSQLYKQAGNSIVVKVLEGILEGLIDG